MMRSLDCTFAEYQPIFPLVTVTILNRVVVKMGANTILLGEL
jgi:hypothetical protein